MKFFHRHHFDPDKWKLVSKIKIVRRHWAQWGEDDMGEQFLYSNTCTECGDLVFRRVREIE